MKISYKDKASVFIAPFGMIMFFIFILESIYETDNYNRDSTFGLIISVILAVIFVGFQFTFIKMTFYACRIVELNKDGVVIKYPFMKPIKRNWDDFKVKRVYDFHKELREKRLDLHGLNPRAGIPGFDHQKFLLLAIDDSKVNLKKYASLVNDNYFSVIIIFFDRIRSTQFDVLECDGNELRKNLAEWEVNVKEN